MDVDLDIAAEYTYTFTLGMGLPVLSTTKPLKVTVWARVTVTEESSVTLTVILTGPYGLSGGGVALIETLELVKTETLKLPSLSEVAHASNQPEMSSKEVPPLT